MHAFTRLTSFLLFILSLNFLACALPTPANSGSKDLAIRNVQADALVAACVQLKADVTVHAAVLAKVETLVDAKAAVAVIVKDLNLAAKVFMSLGAGLELDEKVKVEVVACIAAVISVIAQACLSVSLKLGLAVCLVIFAQLDVALRLVLVKLDICVNGIVALIVKALAQVAVEALIKINLHLCANVLGLLKISL
ncbi:hypothetical protein RhiJN_00225 [Ceratobasidium sp. AG-Ba]|nr:hypothetical protein RhiJN_00225 [Ceratobasidium sp. AG-Ba]QRW01258.1 hypothetical protein RhiLY_00255 [Ceratobasidium sp. AG-Ba]